MNVATVIIVAAFAIIGWQVYETVIDYRRETGTTWQRLVGAFKASATLAWTRLNAVSVFLVTAVTTVADWLGAPGLKDTVSPLLTPQLLVAYTLVVLIGAEVARRRTLKASA